MEKIICILPDLKTLSSTLENYFVQNVGMVETTYSDGFYMLHIPNFIASWVMVQVAKMEVLLAKMEVKDVKVFFFSEYLHN